ncbi:MAG: Na/Pi cotransporter family protein [Spirochaetia bacterium]
MEAVLQVINLIGGLGIFLIGMRIMGEGIQRRAGDRLRKVLHRLTDNRFSGVLTGMGVTAVIQSSSATTVLLVGLVNAGLITLTQSIGVVMGANIGTTFTAWMVSILGFKVKITSLALPAIAIAIPFYFSASAKRRETAEILIGFGLLFLGLHLMKESVPDIKNNPEILSFLSRWSNWGYGSIFIFILVGTLLTVIVQSSSAAMAITITMAFRGWISFPIAAAIVLGENIGTTLTAFLASIPMNATAKRTARAHMIFNIIGVVWMLFLFYPFTRMVDTIMPGDVTDPVNIPVHLSLFHSLFNIANTILLIPFVTFLGKIAEMLVKEKAPVPGTQAYKLRLIPTNLPDALESNLITIQGELAEMGSLTLRMMELIREVIAEPKRISKIEMEIAEKEQLTDDMQEEITRFLTQCMQLPVSENQARNIHSSQRIAHELESIADSCFSITLHLNRLLKKGWRIHDEANKELSKYTLQVMDFLRYNDDYLERKTEFYDYDEAQKMEDGIDKVRKKLRKRSRKTIEKGTDGDVKGELIFIDIVRHLEHIGDNCLNITDALADMEGFIQKT